MNEDDRNRSIPLKGRLNKAVRTGSYDQMNLERHFRNIKDDAVTPEAKIEQCVVTYKDNVEGTV